MMDNNSPNPNPATEAGDLISKWEEGQRSDGFDPIPILKSLCEIVENETELFRRKDPDPLDERHPSRSDPDSTLGQVLKVALKKDSFYNKFTGDYMRDNFWSNQPEKNFELNAVACRLLLDLLPGLEAMVVFENSESLVVRLHQWAERGQEPLASYAIGLLAAAMEVHEVAATHVKERGTGLVDVLIQRLIKFQEEYLHAEARENASDQASENRPFAQFSRNPRKRRLEIKSDNTNPAMPPRKKRPGFIHSTPNADDSNSSWVELENFVIGSFKVSPINLEAQQVFILRYLSPMGEYPDLLCFVLKYNAIQVVRKYMDFSVHRSARLAFEAAKYLTALLVHKKVAVDFVNSDGLLCLLDVPRPSIAATGVALCLYYLSCSPDAMERVCQYPEEVIEKLVHYELWLLECSHRSGRIQAMLFLAYAFRYRVILEIFDKLGGLRQLTNTISTLKILLPDEHEEESEDDLNYSKQCIRHISSALSRYFEAHLIILAENVSEVDASSTWCDGSSPASVRNGSSGCTAPSSPSVLKMIEDRNALILELASARRNWPPVVRFVDLGGLTLLLRAIGMSFGWNFPGRAECIKNALDVLAVCAISPLAQDIYKHKLPMKSENGENTTHQTVGISIILMACEGEYCSDPEVQKAALNALIPCICAPYPSAMSRSWSATPSDVQRQLKLYKTEDTLSRRMRDCVRMNNGIMVLYSLMRAKSPITDADELRALACQALAGLARSESVRQVIGKHSLLGELHSYLREPILPEKKNEHLRFSKYFTELLELVSDGFSQVTTKDLELSMEALHRMDVVARTKINYNKKQVLMIIQQHLLSEGLHESAATLMREANLPVLNPAPRTPGPSILGRASLGNLASTPSIGSSSGSSTATPAPPSTPMRFVLQHSSRQQGTGSPAAAVVKSLNKQPLSSAVTSCPTSCPGSSQSLGLAGKKTVTLDKLVTEYLMSQHARCKNPMITCPEFDLFLPHKCPERKAGSQAPWNLMARISNRQIFPKFGGRDGGAMTRRLLYSRFAPVTTYRANPDDAATFHSCSFSPHDKFVLAGDDIGQLRMFNRTSGVEEGVYTCHDGKPLTHLNPNHDGTLLLTSAYGSSQTPKSCLWYIGEFFEARHTFDTDDVVEWCNSPSQDKIVGTREESARIYDAATGKLISDLVPPEGYHNSYMKNRATFCPTDDLVLSDGVLWDVRGAKPIHKFDKFNQVLNGVFHPNGLHIVSYTEVWDIRTFHLLKQVPGLKYREAKFVNAGDVFFGVPDSGFQEPDDPVLSASTSTFRTFDANDYSNIATIDVRREIEDLAVDMKDLNILIIENSSDDSVIRRYEVGRRKKGDDDSDTRADDDDEGRDDDDDIDEVDDDDDDGSGSDSQDEDSFFDWLQNNIGGGRGSGPGFQVESFDLEDLYDDGRGNNDGDADQPQEQGEGGGDGAGAGGEGRVGAEEVVEEEGSDSSWETEESWDEEGGDENDTLSSGDLEEVPEEGESSREGRRRERGSGVGRRSRRRRGSRRGRSESEDDDDDDDDGSRFSLADDTF